MISRYGIFCKVVEQGNFTRVAEEVGYTQSAISQNIKALEREIGVTLIRRKRDGVEMTQDGLQYLPYFKAIYAAEQDLAEKMRQMQGLENSHIRIGTFTSLSRTSLPPLMRSFRERYPGVTFQLRQGEYTSVSEWIRDGSVDFGYINPVVSPDIDSMPYLRDEMKAVLPLGHPLADKEELWLEDLAGETLILLDEGDYNVALTTFQARGLQMSVEYEVTDDYTILAMVRQGLGISLLYENVLPGMTEGIAVQKIQDAPNRQVSLGWRSWDTLPYAARLFVDYILHARR